MLNMVPRRHRRHVAAVATLLSLFTLGVAQTVNVESEQGTHASTTLGHDYVLMANTTGDTFVLEGTGSPGLSGVAVPEGTHPVTVEYPAVSPFSGQYKSSIDQGAQNMGTMVGPAVGQGRVNTSGYSQGAHALTNYVGGMGPNAPPMSITLTGDPCVEGTGIMQQPLAQMVTGSRCTPLPTSPNVQVTIISHQGDSIADFPRVYDGINLLDGLAGYDLTHRDGYNNVGLAPSRSYDVGNVHYVTILNPSGETPLLQWLHVRGVYLPKDWENAVRQDTARPDPGPGGISTSPDMVAAATHQVAASVPPPLPADPVAQAWQDNVVAPVQQFVDNVAHPVVAPASMPPPVVPSPVVVNVAAQAADWVQAQPVPPQLAPLANQLVQGLQSLIPR